MNIWLKEISVDDGQEFFECLLELARYKDAFARPVPSDFTFDDFASFKATRVKMFNGIEDKPNLPKTNTYWVMEDDKPIGYATLKHTIDLTKPGGHFGCCLLKDYQNKGIGTIVADELSKIALEELGIEEIIYTSKNDNIQSQKSVEKIGGTLLKVENGYHYYKVNIKEKILDNSKHIK